MLDGTRRISVSSRSWLTGKRARTETCLISVQLDPAGKPETADILLEIRTIQTLLEIRIAVHRPSVRHQADLDKREKATRGVWPAASSDVGVVAITNRDVIIVFPPRLQARLFQRASLILRPRIRRMEDCCTRHGRILLVEKKKTRRK